MKPTKAKKTRASRAARPKLSRPKRIAFSLLALALPFLLLAGAEVALRTLTSYGGYPPTFTHLADFDNGDHLLATNPDSSQAFFFRNKDLPGTLSTYTFRDPKPDDTVRVFLVGGSAIKGFPQTPAFAPSTFLELMLRDAWPDRDVEVINLGTTAVASFPALVMLTECLEHQPDLVVIYSGHNEFFGAYGVASLNTVARSPAMIALQFALRRFALVQWIDALLAGSTTSGAPPETTLMEIMMAQPFTGPDDPIRTSAARNLRAHVREMIRRCRNAGVTPIVCTLPSNERGLAPLGTSKLDHLNPADQDHLRDTLDRARPLADTEPDAVLDDLRAAVDLAPRHARAHWLLARALHASGAHDEAGHHFARALDLDPMPWRATTSQNDALIAAADDTGATLCDVRAAFRDVAEGGSVAWDLMDDHVHMSLRGQALAARAVVRSLTTVDGPLHVEPERFDSLPPWTDYAYRLGDNRFERYAVAYRMRRLFDVPFFRDSNRHALLVMDERMRDLEADMSQSELRMVRTWQDPKVNDGYSRPISSLLAALAMQEGRFEDAAHLFLAAMNAMPDYSTMSVEYAYLHCRAIQRDRGTLDPRAERIARSALDRATFMLAHSPEPEFRLHRHAGTLLKVLGRHEDSIPHLLAARAGFTGPGLVEIDQAIVHSYLQTGNLDAARRLTERGIAGGGQFVPIYQAMHDQITATPEPTPAPPAPAPGDPESQK